eukprot:scaffold2907_cov105-Cylindrotheca_fusiformis.AAC.1
MQLLDLIHVDCVEKASVEQQKFRMNGQTTVEGQTACQHFGFGIQNGWTDDRRRTDGMSTFLDIGVEGQTNGRRTDDR